MDGAPFVAVHGEARQEVVPDLFPLEVSLSETSTDAAGTQAKIEALASRILAIADRMKIDEADLTVANLSITPQYDYDDDQDKQIFLGNSYERDIVVRFHALDRLREFVSAMPEDRAVRVGTKTFETTRADEVKRGLMKQAIADARATAESLAAGVGRKLGPVHTISNQGLNVRYSQGGGTSLASVSVSGTMALLAPGVAALREGRITLDQDVYIIYALE
jgi:uncharacterized protein YggE